MIFLIEFSPQRMQLVRGTAHVGMNSVVLDEIK